jgi:hypothetical protein
MANETEDSLPISQFQYLEAKLDQFDNSYKLLSTISSANFDGAIPDDIIDYPDATSYDIEPGRYILINDAFCLVTTSYENINSSTTDTESYEVFYVESDGVEQSKTILPGEDNFTDGTTLTVRKDDWDNKSVGTSGWSITTEGNSIFSNVAVRGRIEATDGYFDGNLTVGDPDDPDSLGSMKIGTDVFGSNDGIHINGTNYWYDTGNFSLGTGTSTISFNGSNILFGTGIEISGSISANSLLLNNGAFSMSIQSNHNVVPSSQRTVNQLVLSSSTPQLVLTTSTNHNFVEDDFIDLSALSNSGGGLGALNKVFQIDSVTSNTITINSSQSIESISVNADNSDTTLTVADSEGVYVGMTVSGTGIASNTTVTNVTDTVITISNATTQALSNVSITFATIPGTYDSSDAGWTNGIVQYSYDGIYVNQNNYWFSNGLFKIGNNTSSVSWNNSVLNVTGQITATSGTIGGFTIGATSLTAGSDDSSVGLAPGTFPFFAGNANASIAPFRVSNAGVLTATGANITGAITATSGTFTGTINANSGTFTSTVTVGGATSGTLQVGSGTNKIKIIGTSLDSTTYINTGSTTATTGNGFYFGADGKVRIASATNSLTFDGNNLSIVGGGTFTGALSGGTISIGTGNSIFKADTNGIYLGNATFGSAPFRVTPAGALTATNATITGAITASSGTFTGTVNITNGGSLVTGNTSDGVTIYLILEYLDMSRDQKYFLFQPHQA